MVREGPLGPSLSHTLSRACARLWPAVAGFLAFRPTLFRFWLCFEVFGEIYSGLKILVREIFVNFVEILREICEISVIFGSIYQASVRKDEASVI